MYAQAPIMHQQPPPLPGPHYYQQAAMMQHRVHHTADSPRSSSGASSQQPSPTRTPPLGSTAPAVTSYYMPMPLYPHPPPSLIAAADSGYVSQLGSLTSSPASSISSEHQMRQQQQHMPGDHMSAAGLVLQPPVQPLLFPFGLPLPFVGHPFPPLLLAPPQPPQSPQAAAAAAAAAAAFLQHHHHHQQQQQQQQQLAGCPVFEQDLPDSCRLHSAPAYRAYNFGSHVPPFDIVKWYGEKPPFILDGRTACLYKMREIDRKLPASLVLSADAEYNTVLAEYYILRNMFGPEYSLQDNVFIKLNRSKEGELAKFIHIFFRERQDAEVYMANAHKFGALTPAWSNPRSFSQNNVYITSVPYQLLGKESLCGYVREFVLGKGAGAADPIKRARVDAEKRSAQIEFHRSEDAETLIAYFYQHIPEANARPAFDNAKEQRASEGAAPSGEQN